MNIPETPPELLEEMKYQEFVLNASGLATITKTGETKKPKKKDMKPKRPPHHDECPCNTCKPKKK